MNNQTAYLPITSSYQLPHKYRYLNSQESAVAKAYDRRMIFENGLRLSSITALVEDNVIRHCFTAYSPVYGYNPPEYPKRNGLVIYHPYMVLFGRLDGIDHKFSQDEVYKHSEFIRGYMRQKCVVEYTCGRNDVPTMQAFCESHDPDRALYLAPLLVEAYQSDNVNFTNGVRNAITSDTYKVYKYEHDGETVYLKSDGYRIDKMFHTGKTRLGFGNDGYEPDLTGEKLHSVTLYTDPDPD